jgi:hypothetical protein
LLLLALAAYFYALPAASDPYRAMPAQTTLVVELNDSDQAERLSGPESAAADWKQILQTPLLSGMREDAKLAGALFKSSQTLYPAFVHGKLLAGFTLLAADSMHAILAVDLRQDFDLKSVLPANITAGMVLENRFKGHTLFTVRLSNGARTAIAQSGSLLIFSRKTYLVEDALERLTSQTFALKTAPAWMEFQPNAPIRMLVPVESMAKLLEQNLKAPWQNLASLLRDNVRWVGLAYDGKETHGLVESTGFMSTMKNWGTSASDPVFSILPDHTAFLATASYDNRLAFWKSDDAPAFRKYVQPWTSGQASVVITNPLSEGMKEEQFVVMAAPDTAAAVSSLVGYGKDKGMLDTRDYQTFRLYTFLNNALLLPVTGDNPAFRNPACALIGNYVVFASSRPALEIWIDKYIVNQTLANQTDFLAAYSQADHQANGSIWFNMAQLEGLMRQLFGARATEPAGEGPLPGLGFIGLSLKTRSDALIDVQVSAGGHGAQTEQTGIVWRTALGAVAATQPYLLTSRAGTSRILIQDVQGELNCLDLNGTVLWKRQIGARIKSGIYGMDYHGNDSDCYLFNTEKNVWLMDENGKDVEGYPLFLQSGAANGLTLVDFDLSRKYSYFIACRNGNLYGYDQYGRPLTGWNPQGGVGQVSHPMVHFQSDHKDYCCVLNDAGQLRVFGRNGAPRRPPIQIGAVSGPIQANLSADHPNIIGFTADGGVISCNPESGQVLVKPGRLGSGKFHGFCSSRAPNDLTLIFGVQGGVFGQITWKDPHWITQKFPGSLDTLFAPSPATIGLLDRGRSRIWLLDKNNNRIPGFPLAGSTPFALSPVPGDPKESMLIAGNGTFVYAYKLQ